jgi:hypothetical protein
MLKTPARRADVHSMCLAYSTPPPVQCAQTQQAPSPSRAEECATNFASHLSSDPPLLPKHSIWTGTQSSLGLSLPPPLPPDSHLSSVQFPVSLPRMRLSDTMAIHAHTLSVCKHIYFIYICTHTHTHTPTLTLTGWDTSAYCSDPYLGGLPVYLRRRIHVL